MHSVHDKKIQLFLQMDTANFHMNNQDLCDHTSRKIYSLMQKPKSSYTSHSFVELTFLKGSVINLGTKLYNKPPN